MRSRLRRVAGWLFAHTLGNWRFMALWCVLWAAYDWLLYDGVWRWLMSGASAALGVAFVTLGLTRRSYTVRVREGGGPWPEEE